MQCESVCLLLQVGLLNGMGWDFKEDKFCWLTFTSNLFTVCYDLWAFVELNSILFLSLYFIIPWFFSYLWFMRWVYPFLRSSCRSDGASSLEPRRIRRRSISITPEIGDDIVRLMVHLRCLQIYICFMMKFAILSACCCLWHVWVDCFFSIFLIYFSSTWFLVDICMPVPVPGYVKGECFLESFCFLNMFLCRYRVNQLFICPSYSLCSLILYSVFGCSGLGGLVCFSHSLIWLICWLSNIFCYWFETINCLMSRTTDSVGSHEWLEMLRSGQVIYI